MAHYYFNIYNDEVTLDPEGAEFPDDDAAMANALREARVLAAESVRQGHLVRGHRIEVVDEQHFPVGAVRFDEAVRITA